MDLGECRLCNKTKNLCKAHLIPDGVRKFVTDINEPGDHFIKSSINSKRTFKSQTLEFDKHILCGECDNLLGKYDNALITMLQNWLKHNDRAGISDRNVKILKVNVPSGEVLLGIAAIILRFSYSSRFKQVSLGKQYEEKFAQWVRQGVVSNLASNEFSVKIIGYPIAEGDIVNILQSKPNVSKYNFSYYYYFILPGIWVCAKVGKGNWVEGLSQ